MSPVYAERLGEKRILVKVPWMDGHGSEMAKKVAGARPKWDRRGVRDRFDGWTYPLDLETCRSLRRIFREHLEAGPALREWVKAAKEQEALLGALRSAHGKDLLPLLTRARRMAPELYAAFRDRPFQAPGVLFAARGHQTLNSDQPGLGKTLQALGAVVEDDARHTLILCRRSAVISVWAREIYRWLGKEASVYACQGTNEERQRIISRFARGQYHAGHAFRFLICNSEMVRTAKVCQNGNSRTRCKRVCAHDEDPEYLPDYDYPSLFALPPFDAIIADESHRGIVGLSDKSLEVAQVRNGMMKLPRDERTMVIALSGTPFRGSNEKAWGTLNFLDPVVFASRWKFLDEYFEVVDGEYGKIVGEVRPGRVKAFDRMMARYVLRRTKAEVAPDMPPKQYAGSLLDVTDPNSPISVWLEMTPRQEQAYRRMKENGDAEVRGGTILTAGILAEMTRLRQFATSACRVQKNADGDIVVFPAAPSNKLDWLLEFLDDLGGEGKVIVASQFTALLEMFHGKLKTAGHAPALLTGKQSDKERLAVQDAFQEGDLSLALVNTLAGGESINLSKASYMVFLDETWIPDEQEQMEDRGDRLGHPTQLTVYYLRSRGTIEEDIARTTGLREGAVKERLDGSRGVEFRKKMVR